MQGARQWSVKHAKGLDRLYRLVEAGLVAVHPLLLRLGYKRAERLVYFFEKRVKGLLFGSQSCGQCVLGATGMACPMNCPKHIRNGPCGGVRQDGSCELDPSMPCVWVLAWEGSQRIRAGTEKIQLVQPAVDHSLAGSSAWLRAASLRAAEEKAAPAAQAVGEGHASN